MTLKDIRMRMAIPLRNRQGIIIANAIVDDEDYNRVIAKGRWSLNPNRYNYVYRRDTMQGKQVEVKLHRFILNLSKGDPLVDHINRNPLDNRKENLRLGTTALNAQNLDSRPGSRSKYRGVIWQKDINRWRARVRLNYKTYHLGTFLNEDDAGEAAAKFRQLNMPFSKEALIL